MAVGQRNRCLADPAFALALLRRKPPGFMVKLGATNREIENWGVAKR
jgi:hypothetical protein